MAVTFPLEIPTSIGLSNIVLTSDDSVVTSSSPFTYKQQVISHGGQRWSAEITIPPILRDLASPWVSFLTKLKGQTGTFLLGDPNAKQPLGSIYDLGGNIYVNGASQDGETLNVDGLPVSENGLLLEGDYIQIGAGSSARLHKVLTDLDSDSSGEGAIDIWPSLRYSPDDDQEVYYENTVGLFRLATNTRGYSINTSSQYNISFSAIEAI